MKRIYTRPNNAPEGFGWYCKRCNKFVLDNQDVYILDNQDGYKGVTPQEKCYFVNEGMGCIRSRCPLYDNKKCVGEILL